MTLPLALEESEAVLGAVMLNPGWLDHAKLSASHFYDPTHAALWDELKQRQRDGRLIDMLSLKEWSRVHFKDLGGVDYLMHLSGVGAATSSQIAGYADAIRDAARRRAVIDASKAAIAQAEKGDDDALTALEQRLQEIASNDADADSWERLGVHACESVERAELGETKGVSTGFPALDRATGGLQPGTLWVVGGATSMGKSVFGAGLGRNIAAQGYGVGEIHLEMDATQIGLRTATALAFEPDHRKANPYYLSAQRGDLTAEQWSALRGAAKASAALPIYTDARPGRTLSQIEAAARRLFRKMRREGIKPGALIIDHEGLIAPEAGERFPSQLERATARGERLLAIGKRLGVGVIALAQVTNEGARADGEDRLPVSQDIKWGGAITQAASVVILLHRKAYYAERKPESKRTPEDWDTLRSREATLVVDKARGGLRQQVPILMDMPTAAVWAP